MFFKASHLEKARASGFEHHTVIKTIALYEYQDHDEGSSEGKLLGVQCDIFLHRNW